jgi:hypothetical protein
MDIIIDPLIKPLSRKKIAIYYLFYFLLANFIIPGIILLLSHGLFGWPVIAFMMLIAPVCSYFIFNKIISQVSSSKNKIIWYILHSFFAFLVPAFILFLFIASALSNIQIG